MIKYFKNLFTPMKVKENRAHVRIVVNTVREGQYALAIQYMETIGVLNDRSFWHEFNMHLDIMDPVRARLDDEITKYQVKNKTRIAINLN